MASWVDVVSSKSWNLSTSRFYCSDKLDALSLQGNRIDRFDIPYEHRSFIASASRAIPIVYESESAHLLKNCFNSRVPVKITPFQSLQSQRLVPANHGRNSGVSATASVQAVKTEDRVELSVLPKLSDRWREIQGANDWKNLLDPPDPILKAEIIKYGEFAQLCYDAFDYDSHSEFCGSCRFNPRKLLKEFGLRDEGYEVTKYLYATSDISLPTFFRRSDSNDPWSTSSNWIGFVAVSTCEKEIERLGRRDIVVAWRGTVTQLDWLADLQKSLCPSGLDPRSVGRSINGDVRVESGFLSLYTTKKETARYNQQSAREQLLSEIERLRELYRGEQLSITLTGHSLGAALALLSGYDVAESGLNRKLGGAAPSPSCKPSASMSLENIFNHEQELRHWEEEGEEEERIPVTVVSFAGPRVGNSAFGDRIKHLGVKVLRIVNANDLVPKVPGVLLNEKFRFIHEWIEKVPWTYSHVGVEFAVNNNHSPFLERSLDPSCLHNLEAYMHLIDGYRGPGKPFSGVLSRDPALVNKNSNFLKRHLKTPGFWRQDKDKGLIKHPDGRLKFRGREPEDIPPYH